MLKKLSLKKNTIKNIFIVFTAMLVIPVMAFAVTTAENPLDQDDDQNRDIKITSEDNGIDGATNASPLITSDGALGSDGATSATGDSQSQGSLGSGKPDGVTSATGTPGEDVDNDDYDSDSEDEDDEDDDDD